MAAGAKNEERDKSTLSQQNENNGITLLSPFYHEQKRFQGCGSESHPLLSSLRQVANKQSREVKKVLRSETVAIFI
jgi:hypothetical protein